MLPIGFPIPIKWLTLNVDEWGHALRRRRYRAAFECPHSASESNRNVKCLLLHGLLRSSLASRLTSSYLDVFVFRHVLDCPMSETSKMIWSYPEGTHGAGIIGYGFFIFILFHSLLGRDLSDDSSVPRFRFCVSWCFASKHGQLVLMERPFSRRISVELVLIVQDLVSLFFGSGIDRWNTG